MVFLCAQTQWNVGMGGATGLRYEGLEVVARLMEVEMTPHVFHLIQLLEAKRLLIWREEHDAATAKAAAEKNKGKK